MSGWNLKLVSKLASKLASGVMVLNILQPLQATEQAIDLELLEFLGEWVTDDGEWVDPEQLEDEEENDHEKTTK